MAHFAKIGLDSKVIRVSVVDNKNLLDADGNEVESIGVTYLNGVYGDDDTYIWKQTSYNGTFRKNFAGIGYTYDSVRDAFIPPNEYGSWVLNDETCIWENPVLRPDLETNSFGGYKNKWFWDEDTVSWVLEGVVE
jgi:hypothetical protein